MENNSRKPKEYMRVRYRNGGDMMGDEGEYRRSRGILIIEMGIETYYKRELVNRWYGPVYVNLQKERPKVIKSFPIYVEKIDNKYYDLITGIEVVTDSYNDIVPKLKYGYCTKVNSDEVYRFLKGMTSNDILLYKRKFIEAHNNAVRAYNDAIIKQRSEEDYISRFRENNNIQRKKH